MSVCMCLCVCVSLCPCDCVSVNVSVCVFVCVRCGRVPARLAVQSARSISVELVLLVIGDALGVLQHELHRMLARERV